MENIKLIFFDYDGTIADTIPGIVSAVNAMLQKLGLSQRESGEIISFIGNGQKYLIEASVGSKKEITYDDAYAVFDEYYKNHLDDQLKLYPGVKEGLEYFKDTVKIIISNKNTVYIEAGLEMLGIDAYFKDVLGGDLTEQRKPSPDSLYKLLKKYNVSPQNAVIVGDMDIDIKTGKNAGIITCGVTYGLGSQESLQRAGADYIVDSIIELINNLNVR